MMATTMKRYIVMALFDFQNTFGTMLTTNECKNHLEEIYGGIR